MANVCECKIYDLHVRVLANLQKYPTLVPVKNSHLKISTIVQEISHTLIKIREKQNVVLTSKITLR